MSVNGSFHVDEDNEDASVNEVRLWGTLIFVVVVFACMGGTVALVGYLKGHLI